MSKHKNRRRLISSETTGLPDKIYSAVPKLVVRLERQSRILKSQSMESIFNAKHLFVS